jgi:hypothetical protein
MIWRDFEGGPPIIIGNTAVGFDSAGCFHFSKKRGKRTNEKDNARRERRMLQDTPAQRALRMPWRGWPHEIMSRKCVTSVEF